MLFPTIFGATHSLLPTLAGQMDTTEPTISDYQRTNKEQFEALGQFVQAFELMVDAVRRVITDLLSRGNDANHADQIRVVLYHRSMNAGALFEVLRALYGEILRQRGSNFPSKDREIVTSLLSQMAKEYGNLADRRNTILHGTWRIGVRPNDDQSTIIDVGRKISSEGLKVRGLPKNTSELSDLIDACDETRRLVSAMGIVSVWPQLGGFARQFYKEKKGRWKTRIKPDSPSIPGRLPQSD
jgi:hypothetical protein